MHLNIELFLVNGEAILTTNQLGKVEGESVGVEQTESLDAIQLTLALSLQFLHSLVKQRDTLVEGAQEAVFLLLNHFGNQLLLSLQLREGVAHLMNEGWNELIEEAVLLSEEGVGITYGTTQNTTDDITSLSVRRQLTVGNRERYSAQVVGTNTHGDVDIFLAFSYWLLAISFFLEGGILKTSNILLSLDDGLEYVGIVVRVLALHHAHQALEAHTGIDDVH